MNISTPRAAVMLSLAFVGWTGTTAFAFGKAGTVDGAGNVSIPAAALTFPPYRPGADHFGLRIDEWVPRTLRLRAHLDHEIDAAR